MTNQRIAGEYSDDEISLLDLWLILRKEWIVPTTTTVMGIIVALVAALTMTPIYRAEAIVAEVDSGGGGQSAASALLRQFGGLSNLAGVNLQGLAGNRNDGRTIIQSRTFIEQFIMEQGLMPLIYADLWDEAAQDWDAEVNTAPAYWQGANRFSNDVFYIDEETETGLLTLAIEWEDPEIAANWANRLVELANEIARKQDIEAAATNIAYLNEQIELTNAVELERVLYNLVETEQKTLMLANARKEYVFQVVDPAVVPVTVAKPKRLLLIILGAFSGGFLGLVVVFTRSVARGLKEQEVARDSKRQHV